MRVASQGWYTARASGADVPIGMGSKRRAAVARSSTRVSLALVPDTSRLHTRICECGLRRSDSVGSTPVHLRYFSILGLGSHSTSYCMCDQASSALWRVCRLVDRVLQSAGLNSERRRLPGVRKHGIHCRQVKRARLVWLHNSFLSGLRRIFFHALWQNRKRCRCPS